MKKYFIVIFLFQFNASIAQDNEIDTFIFRKAQENISEKVKLDFAVPDIPAFKALGIDPSKILRPSSAKDFALVFSNFNSSGASVVPNNVAVEIAPLLLSNIWYTLDEYRSNAGIRFLSKARLSLGSSIEDETNAHNTAFGLRVTLIDNGDFRKDASFQQNHIYDRMDPLQEILTTKRRAVIINYGGPGHYNQLSSEKRAEILDSLFKVSQNDVGFLLDQTIDESIETYKKENWNASRWDLAYSYVIQSPDSLLQNFKPNKHLIWTTFAFKPGKNNNWAQILFGINNSILRAENKWYNEFNGNLRIYAGANKFKGLFEVQYQNIDHPINDRKKTLFTQIGLEANVFKGAWIHLSTGILNALNDDNKAALRSNLNLYLTFPEDFNPFR